MSEHVNEAGGDTLPKSSIFRPLKDKIRRLGTFLAIRLVNLQSGEFVGEVIRYVGKSHTISEMIKCHFHKIFLYFCRILLIWQLSKNGAKLSLSSILITHDSILSERKSKIRLFDYFRKKINIVTHEIFSMIYLLNPKKE